MRFGIPWFEPNCLFISGYGFIQLPLLGERGAQIAVGFGVVGLEPQSLPIAPDCLVHLALVLQHNPEVILRFGEIRVQT